MTALLGFVTDVTPDRQLLLSYIAMVLVVILADLAMKDGNKTYEGEK